MLLFKVSENPIEQDIYNDPELQNAISEEFNCNDERLHVTVLNLRQSDMKKSLDVAAKKLKLLRLRILNNRNPDRVFQIRVNVFTNRNYYHYQFLISLINYRYDTMVINDENDSSRNLIMLFVQWLESEATFLYTIGHEIGHHVSKHFTRRFPAPKIKDPKWHHHKPEEYHADLFGLMVCRSLQTYKDAVTNDDPSREKEYTDRRDQFDSLVKGSSCPLKSVYGVKA